MGMGGRHAPAALSPGKRAGAHCIRGCVGPRDSLDGCEKYRPHRDSIAGSPNPQRVAIPINFAQYDVQYKSHKNRYTIPDFLNL
jgi:hypothetical protein